MFMLFLETFLCFAKVFRKNFVVAKESCQRERTEVAEMEGNPWIWSSCAHISHQVLLKAVSWLDSPSSGKSSLLPGWGQLNLLWQEQCITPFPSPRGYQFPLKVGVALKSHFEIWSINPLYLPLCSPLSHLLARCEVPGPSGALVVAGTPERKSLGPRMTVWSRHLPSHLH